jgi:HD-like signal output (HDOD) protein
VSDSLASDTVARVTAGLQTARATGIPKVVELVRALAANVQDISVDELAATIGRDVTITARVLAAANTFGYNPSGVPIRTVAEAIQIIGFARIRVLTMSLLLAESTDQRFNEAEQGEAAALALSSGLLAQSLAARHAQIDPEQVFVAATLRNFGRILMTAFLLEDYRRVQELAPTLGLDQAFREVLGLTPLELGYELLKTAKLPSLLLASLEPVPAERVSRHVADSIADTLALAEYAVQVAQAALRADLTVEDFERTCVVLGRQLPSHLAGDIHVVRDALALSESQFRHLAIIADAGSGAKEACRCLRARANGRVPGPPPPEKAPDGSVTLLAAAPRSASWLGDLPPLPPAVPAPLPVGTAAAAALPRTERLLAEARERLAQAAIDAATAQATVMAAVHQALGTETSVLFIAATEHELLPAGGAGFMWEARSPAVKVRRGERSVCGLCVARGEPVVIHDAGDPRLARYLPAWLEGGTRPGAFLVLPIVAAQRTVGLLLTGWRDPRPLQFAPEEIRALRYLLAEFGRIAAPAAAAA